MLELRELFMLQLNADQFLVFILPENIFVSVIDLHIDRSVCSLTITSIIGRSIN